MIYLLILIAILLITTVYLLRKKMKYLLFASLIILIVLIGFKAIKGFMPIPLSIRHFFHLLMPSKNLYDPIISDRFNLKVC